MLPTLVTKVRAVLEELPPTQASDSGDATAEGGSDATVEGSSATAGGCSVTTAEDAIALGPELGADPEVVRAHLASLPERYAAAVTPRAVVRHALMARSRPGPSEVRTRVTPGERRTADPAPAPDPAADPDPAPDPDRAPDELDVVAIDHPGWFAKVAGVLALHGGSILAADAFTRGDGLAVDTFRVRPPEGVGGSWWAGVEGDLAEAAAGRLAVRARVARIARSEDGRHARRPDVTTTVTTELDPSGTATVLEVRTADRLGVLYAIATALAELELDIVLARIETLGAEVVDAFHLRDADDGPLDRDHAAELDLAVRSALAER